MLALQTARSEGHECVAFAIREEASPEVQKAAARCHWISLGDLSRLIDLCHQEGITQIMMAGQVKHVNIFSAIRPDWRLAKLLATVATKNTDSLIGAVQKVLSDEGVNLVDSTLLLKPLLAPEGAISKRKLDSAEIRDAEYGRRIAHMLASMDLGQSVAIADRACVALEAMEGTDALLRRAASLVNGQPLRLIKASSRRRHLLFDVPVVGPGTIDVMVETGTTALVVDAGRTLMLDREILLEKANSAHIAIAGMGALE